MKDPASVPPKNLSGAIRNRTLEHPSALSIAVYWFSKKEINDKGTEQFCQEGCALCPEGLAPQLQSQRRSPEPTGGGAGGKRRHQPLSLSEQTSKLLKILCGAALGHRRS